MDFYTYEISKIAEEYDRSYEEQINEIEDDIQGSARKRNIQNAGGALGIAIGAPTIKKVKQRGGLTGRSRLYHGTSRIDADMIRKSGFKTTPAKEGKITSPVIKNLIDAGMIEDKPYDFGYLTPRKKVANIFAASKFPGEVVQIDVPAYEYDNFIKNKNPELMNTKNYKDYRQKYHKALTRLEEKNLLPKKPNFIEKEIVPFFNYKSLNDAVLTDKTIPTKYIKGSNDYQKLTAKEVANYIKDNPKRFAKNLGLAGISGAGVIGGGYLLSKNIKDNSNKQKKLKELRGKQSELIEDADFHYNTSNLPQYKEEYDKLMNDYKIANKEMGANAMKALGGIGAGVGSTVLASRIKNPKLRVAGYGASGLLGSGIYYANAKRNTKKHKENRSLRERHEDLARRITEEM